MGKLIMITGGARSGKSTYAEELTGSFGRDVLYIATSIAFDDEMKHRIKKHREQRPVHWETLEAYKDLDEKIMATIDGKSAVMLDCITIMVTNLMLESDIDWDRLTSADIAAMESLIRRETEKLINTAKAAQIPFILVTNETGMGIVPDNAISRVFRDISGRINQMVARAADEVYLCVSGIPVKIKG